jgi:hypothetical protein
MTRSSGRLYRRGSPRTANSASGSLSGESHFVQRLETLLFGHDPIGLNSEFNKDEYRAEAETITLLLSEATNQGDAQRIIHEEFVRCFDAQLAGPPERYTAIASETWSDWIAFTNRTGG